MDIGTCLESPVVAEVAEEVPRTKIVKQRFKGRGEIESILLHAQLTGAIIAQNLTAPTSSTASAMNGRSERRAITAALLPESDIRVPMSAFGPITSALPQRADVHVASAGLPLMTQAV